MLVDRLLLMCAACADGRRGGEGRDCEKARMKALGKAIGQAGGINP